MDLVGSYEVGPVWDGHDGFLKGRFLAKEDSIYTWMVGLRGGYTAGDFTIAGHVNMFYLNEESFLYAGRAACLWKKLSGPAVHGKEEQ